MGAPIVFGAPLGDATRSGSTDLVPSLARIERLPEQVLTEWGVTGGVCVREFL
jgi:hypothetical protein